MAWVNKNFAYSTLGAGLLIGGTSLTLATGDGAKFPATGDFMCVIWDASYSNPSFDPAAEVVKVTARSTDTLTITRAQEGSSAAAWDLGDKIAHTFTAGLLDLVVLTTATQTLTNKTLTTPTIASLENAIHAHQSTAGGGYLSADAITSGILDERRGGTGLDVSSMLSGILKFTSGVGSLVTAPASTIVGISDSQTLSGKTLSGAITSGDFGNAAWANYDGILVGWSGTPTTKQIYYKQIGKFVYVNFYISGTSDSTSTTVDMPLVSAAYPNYVICACYGADNGVYITTGPLLGQLPAVSRTLTISKGWGTGTWTNSGSKQVRGSIFYEAA